jgi:nitroreductase
MQQKKAQTAVPILGALAERWSPRAFSAQAVEEEKLLQLFEAARWAASSRNEQPWRFFIAQKGEPAYDKLFKGLNQWNQKWAYTAPVLGVTLVKKHFTQNGKANAHAWHDLGLAMGNLSAQATHMNLKLHQMGGIEQDYLVSALDIPEDTYEVVAMFALGYHDIKRLEELDERYHESEKSPRQRRPLTDLLFSASFGENPHWLKEEKN